MTTRAVLGALYDRIRLSGYNVIGGCDQWYDQLEQRVFCVYAQEELAELLGVSTRTIRRSLQILSDAGLVWWRKASYRGSCRFFMHDGIMEYLRPSPIRTDCPP